MAGCCTLCCTNTGKPITSSKSVLEVELRGFEPLTPSMRRRPGGRRRRRTSGNGASACGDGGWISLGVGLCLLRLAPHLTPRYLVSNANVRPSTALCRPPDDVDLWQAGYARLTPNRSALQNTNVCATLVRLLARPASAPSRERAACGFTTLRHSFAVAALANYHADGADAQATATGSGHRFSVPLGVVVHLLLPAGRADAGGRGTSRLKGFSSVQLGDLNYR